MPTATNFSPAIDQTIYSNEIVLTSTYPLYIAISGSRAPSGTLADHEVKLDRATSFMNLGVYLSATPPSATTIRAVLLVNGSETGLKVDMTNAVPVDNWYEDIVNIAKAAAGDLVAIKLNRTAGSGSDGCTIQTVTMVRSMQ